MFFYFQHQPTFFLDDDSSGYLQLAENVRQGQGFSWEAHEPYTPNSFRTPGFPFFLMMHRVIFGHYQSALVTQIFLVVATAYLIYLLARELGRPRLRGWAAGIFLFMPFSVMVSLRYLTQPLFVFGLVGAVWIWLKFLKTDQNRYLWLAALLLPLLAFLRPIAFYIYLPFLAGYLWYHYCCGPSVDWIRFFWVAVLTVAVFFLVLSPWLIRNWFLFGHFDLASIASYQLYFYDTPSVYAHNHGISYNEARQFLEQDIRQYVGVGKFEDYMTFEVEKVLSERARHYLTESWAGLIFTRTILFFKFFLRDGLHYWKEFGLPIQLAKWGIGLERGVLGLLSLGLGSSLWRTIRQRDFVSSVSGFMLILIAYFAILTGAVASAGLRFPVEPIIILVGLSGLQALKKLKIRIF